MSKRAFGDARRVTTSVLAHEISRRFGLSEDEATAIEQAGC
jgi:hypothetical protein